MNRICKMCAESFSSSNRFSRCSNCGCSQGWMATAPEPTWWPKWIRTNEKVRWTFWVFITVDLVFLGLIFGVISIFGTGDQSTMTKEDLRASLEEMNPTQTSSTSTTWPSMYGIGDTGPGGGFIFFVDSLQQWPDFDYLEAAPGPIAPGLGNKWCENPLMSGGELRDFGWIGEGQEQTYKILMSGCTVGAAQVANDYENAGQDDWYLPSISEIQFLLDNGYGQNIYVGDLWSSNSQILDRGAQTSTFVGLYVKTDSPYRGQSFVEDPSTWDDQMQGEVRILPIRSF